MMMKINWAKWILEQLPFSLRVNRVYVLCLLFTMPVRMLYASFVDWRQKMRNKAGATPQVCMLKKIVYDELGVNIEIEETDGKDSDFIVRTSRQFIDNERQLHALIDRYKQAGKSCQYINEKVSFEMGWSGYVCEQCEFSSYWDEYIC